MFKIIPLETDSYLSSEFPLANSGLDTQGFIVSSSFDSFLRISGDVYKEKRYICKFDIDEINSQLSGSIDNNDVYLKFHITDLKKTVDTIQVSAYALSSSFVEGGGFMLNSNEPVSWNYRNINTTWSLAGGDFLNDFKYPVTIDEKYKTMKISLNQYIKDFNSGSISNNGLIFVADGYDINNLSFYSKETKTGNEPLIFIHHQDSTNASGSAILYTGSISSQPINFRAFNHKSSLVQGEYFVVNIFIDFLYKRASFNYKQENYFLNNLTYYIYDNTRRRILLEKNDKNNVSLNDGLIISFPTDNIPEGKYSLYLNYTENNISIKSKPINFEIVL